ncbi:MAG: mannitol dehydrogenase family protein [Clostridiales bacterium]|jgi:fructuronate reductase|nr:mannitol dehydrogenase family protein [Clostridiales bacterium]OPZ70123.1 MAG: Polyol:NADP oxidoreductase [Firmicutes bacterium ADurb.Bin467]
MKLLKKEILNNRAQWLDKGYTLPAFDIDQVARETHGSPEWVHFGAGNIFRAFIAEVQQQMLNEGKEKKGIVVAEGYDYEIIDKAYRPFDNLCLSVTLKSEGSILKTVVGSVVESLKMDPASEDWKRLVSIFENPSLKIASFTITEKGYNIKSADGEVFPFVEADFAAGPARVGSYIGKVAALMYARFKAGELPISLVSMDNCSHNGTRLHDAVHAFAAEWARRDLAEPAFAEYVENREKVGFPWSMIDKITPRPDDKVIAMLKKDGFEDTESVKTSKGTFVAPFVNAEETQYLVVEDWFPNGRPNIETARGVLFTERETVDKVERMKVCTCLNPLHTALAVFGCLLGYTLISDEMKDRELRKLVEVIGYREGLPVVVDPGVLDPKEFIDTVVNVRIPNVFMPDTPQRIATDTSQKLAIRFGETIKAYLKRPDLSVEDLKIIPLVFAGWLRYVMGVDDNGNAFALSDDPMLDRMKDALSGIRLGDRGPFEDKLRPIFSNSRIFGVDLYEAGLGELVERYFSELVAGPGAVRKTLQKYLG